MKIHEKIITQEIFIEHRASLVFPFILPADKIPRVSAPGRPDSLTLTGKSLAR